MDLCVNSSGGTGLLWTREFCADPCRGHSSPLLLLLLLLLSLLPSLLLHNSLVHNLKLSEIICLYYYFTIAYTSLLYSTFNIMWNFSSTSKFPQIQNYSLTVHVVFSLLRSSSYMVRDSPMARNGLFKLPSATCPQFHYPALGQSTDVCRNNIHDVGNTTKLIFLCIQV